MRARDYAWYALIAFSVVYFACGFRLSSNAFRYLKPHVDRYSYLDLYDDEKFMPQGAGARRRAIRFLWWGFVFIAFLALLHTWFVVMAEARAVQGGP
jgi:hypothetical protein